MKIDFTPSQAAERIGRAPSTLAVYRWKDRGDNGGRSPEWVEVNGRCIGYTKEAIDKWIADNTAGAA